MRPRAILGQLPQRLSVLGGDGHPEAQLAASGLLGGRHLDGSHPAVGGDVGQWLLTAQGIREVPEAGQGAREISHLAQWVRLPNHLARERQLNCSPAHGRGDLRPLQLGEYVREPTMGG